MVGKAAARIARLLGPATDIAAQSSVTEVSTTRRSGHTACSRNSSHDITSPAFAVEVVMTYGAHIGTVGEVPVMHRRPSYRLEMKADTSPGERADCDRRVGRPEGRRADRWDRSAAELGHEGERVDVARLALVGAHALRGVALQMLDGPVALAIRQADVIRGHVVLQVDEGLATNQRDLLRHLPGERGLVRPGRIDRLGGRAPAAIFGGTMPGLGTLRNRGRRLERSVDPPGGEAARLESVRHEGSDVLAIARLCPDMRGEMDGRGPPARDTDEIARNRVGIAARDRRDLGRVH